MVVTGQGCDNIWETPQFILWLLSTKKNLKTVENRPGLDVLSIPDAKFITSYFPLWSHLVVVILSFFLSKVQSFGERIVLFILNVIIFGRLERSLDDDGMFFLPHSVKEQAKILWRNGAAVGFYSTKMKGEEHMASWGYYPFRLWWWWRCWRNSKCLPILEDPLS